MDIYVTNFLMCAHHSHHKISGKYHPSKYCLIISPNLENIMGLELPKSNFLEGIILPYQMTKTKFT